MKRNDENRLLLSIKIIPLVLFLIIAILGISTVITLKNIQFQEDIDTLTQNYIKKEKQIIKDEVIKVHNNIINEKKLTTERLKENIKEKVYIAHSIATNIYEKYKDSKSKQEIQELIKTALVNFRFNNRRGYLFIYSFDYECILFPLNRDIEGKNFYNFKDGKGKYLTREIIKQVKKEGEGFLTWWYHKPSDMEKQYEKIGFNKHFKPYNWFIGTGEYITDFEEMVKKAITKRLSTYSYGSDYYIFILNNEGITLAHPNKQEIGKDLFYSKDDDGEYFIQNILKSAKKEGEFTQYTLKAVTDKTTTKTSYVKKLEGWNWVIGSGFHKNDLNVIVEQKKKELRDENEAELKTIILISFFVLIIIVILSVILSYSIQQKFKNYKTKVNQKDKMLYEQSKLASMGEMLGNIAHQWRQPLSVISTGATGMKIQKEYDILDDEHFYNTCKIINDNAQYLSKTIDDFRNFIKGDRIQEPFSLKKNIDSFIHLVEGSIKKNEIELVVNMKKDIIINGYNNELIQCFINLFNNSKDALKERLQENRLIIISAYEKDKENVVITIQDNGKGIKESIISKIFEPYFTTKHQASGTGLGLNMTYKFIVNGMHGTINVRNKKFTFNKINYFGAEFTIVLPKN